MDLVSKSRTFLRVVAAGSFSQAARSLGLSLPATSRQILALEDDLGAPLLLRTTRSLRLTDAGRRFHVHAVALVADADAARASVQRDGAIAGELVVSASVALGVLRIVPRLGELLAAHPQLHLEIRLDDRPAELVGEGVDLAVRANLDPPDSAGVIAVPLVAYRRFVVASPGYLRKRGVPRTVLALADHAAITGADGPRETAWRLGGQLVPIRPALRIGTSMGVRAAACAGLGIALLPEALVATDLAAGTLRPVFKGDAGDASPVSVYALSRIELRGDVRIDAVVAHLRATLPL